MTKFCIVTPRFYGILKVIAAILALACTSSVSARAEIYLYNVSVPTGDLSLPANSSDSPYSLAFVLLDGSGTGDDLNTVTASDFNVLGPPSSVTLTEPTFFNSDIESFTPGDTLTFTLSTTNNTDVSGPQDQFLFYILNNSSVGIPTTDTSNGSLFTVDLGGASPVVTPYDGTGTYSDVIPAITPATATPEPSPLVSLAVAFLGLGMLIGLRRRTRANN